MRLSDWAVSLILETLEERAKEAKKEYLEDEDNLYKAGYYEAYFEVMEIIENRKDL